jgi:predicted house-cleaning noncanonical NTP pyrophosphatase (MazG superfamily)
MHKKYRFKTDKLVRDKIPPGMSGAEFYDRAMEKDEYIKRLKDKMLEEAQEVHASDSDIAMREELADILEVVHSMCIAYNLSYEEVDNYRKQKKEVRGGFEKRTYSAFVEMDADHPKVEYFLSQPDKYPQLP